MAAIVKLFNGTYIDLESIQAIEPVKADKNTDNYQHMSFKIILKNATLIVPKSFQLPNYLIRKSTQAPKILGQEYKNFKSDCVMELEDERQKLIEKWKEI